MAEPKNLKFKGFMAEKGIKQKDLAELLGLDLSNINLKVNGNQAWTIPQIKAICEKYGISADKYFI